MKTQKVNWSEAWCRTTLVNVTPIADSSSALTKNLYVI